MIQLKNDSIVAKTFLDGIKSDEMLKVPLAVNMKLGIKDGVIILQMRSQNNTDIRKYRVIINSIYKPLKY